jgi:hypothetical protein
MMIKRFLDALAGFAKFVAWAAIVLATFAMGFSTLPKLYLLLSGQVNPGDLLPDDRVLTLQEYVQQLAYGIALIVGGFAAIAAIRKSSRRSESAKDAEQSDR